MGLRFDEICIDARDATTLGRWWAQVLDWPHDVDEDGDVRLHPPQGAGVPWIFLAVPDEKVVKNRIHLDFRPDDRVLDVEGAQGHSVGQRGDESWVVLADPEGNEFCILAATDD